MQFNTEKAAVPTDEASKAKVMMQKEANSSFLARSSLQVLKQAFLASRSQMQFNMKKAAALTDEATRARVMMKKEMNGE